MAREVNRFDFLRLLFAGIVALFHAVFLSGMDSGGRWETGLAQAAELSIQGFFIISGCLVLGSLIRSERIGLYAEKRIRRLFPAYCLVVLVPALIALFLSGNFQKVLAYVIPNLAFLNFIEPTLPGQTPNGLFENYGGIVNGALWTLKIEVMFYAALPLTWWVMKRAPKLQLPLLLAMIIGAEIWRYTFTNLVDHSYSAQIARQLPGQIGFFAVGIYMWLNLEKFKNTNLATLLAGLFFLILSIWQPLVPGAMAAFRYLGLALVIGWIAFASGPSLNAARFGDMSYGVYITHFPIIQTCIAAGLFASPILGLTVSLGLTALASFALWHLVEKRALLPSSHYRNTS